MRRSRTGDMGLLLRHGGTAPIGALLLALLVGVAVFVTAAAPRAMASLADRELDAGLTSLSPLDSDLAFTGGLSELGAFGVFDGAVAAFDELDLQLESVRTGFGDPLARISSIPAEYYAQLDTEDTTITTADPTDPADPATSRVGPRLRPTVDPDYLDRVRFVAGAAPAEWIGDSSDDSEPAARPPIDIAVSTDAAAKLSAGVGAVFQASSAPFRISGVYEPIDPDDEYWQHDPLLLGARQTPLLTGVTVVESAVYLAPGSLDGLSAEAQGADLTVWFPTSATGLAYADADALLLQLRELDTLGIALEAGQVLLFSSGLASAVQEVQERVVAVDALLALVGSAPLGVVFAVLLLAARATAARRAGAFRLASARGASSGTVRLLALLEGAVIAVPAAVVAVALALALVRADEPVAALAPAAVVGAVVPVYFLVAGVPRGGDRERADLGSRPRRRWRWVLEAGVVGLAVLAVVLLDRRGLLASSAEVGVDPLLAATPLLLSLAVCVVVLRIYPLPLLAVQRRMRRRRSAVGLVGSARAVRDPSLGFVSALAIVVAVSAAVFSGVLAATVTSGIDAAAGQEVGADIRVDSDSQGSDALDPGAIRNQEGVADVVPLRLVPAVDAASARTRIPATLVVADLAALSNIRPDIPAALDTTKGGIPFLASSDLVQRLRVSEITLDGEDAVRAGVLDSSVIPDAGADWILVDSADAARLLDTELVPDRLLVTVDAGTDTASVAARIADRLGGVLSGGAVSGGRVSDGSGSGGSSTGDSAAGSGVVVTDAASVARVIGSRPSVAALSATLWVAAALALVLGALAIAVATVAASGARNRVIAVMRILGASRSQFRGLVIWELVPILVIAGVAGLVLGLGLPFLVSGLIDLRTFVGGTAPVSPDIPIVLVVAIVAGFIVAAALAGSVAVAIARRVDPASSVKIGAE